MHITTRFLGTLPTVEQTSMARELFKIFFVFLWTTHPSENLYATNFISFVTSHLVQYFYTGKEHTGSYFPGTNMLLHHFTFLYAMNFYILYSWYFWPLKFAIFLIMLIHDPIALQNVTRLYHWFLYPQS